MPNSKKNWGDIASALNDSDSLDFDETSKTDEVTETSKSDASEKKEVEKKGGDKKRPRRESAKKEITARKKGTSSKTATAPRNLLDSLDEVKIDLTVGSETGSDPAKKRRRTRKVSETELIRQAEAEEAKKETAKRKKLAEAIEKEAVRPFREIAGQIEGRIQELAQEETEEKAAPSGKSRKKSVKGKKKPVESTVVAEESDWSDSAVDSDDDPWKMDDVLDISWGRSTKASEETTEKETVVEETAAEPPAESFPFESMPVDEEATETEEEEGPDETPVVKLSRKDAEDRFAQLFSEAPVAEEKVDAFRQRSGRPNRPSRQENASEPKMTPKNADSLDDNDFWGIPDEPEIGFASSKKSAARDNSSAPVREKESAFAPRESRSERSDFRGRDSRGAVKEETSEPAPNKEKSFDRSDRTDRPERSDRSGRRDRDRDRGDRDSQRPPRRERFGSQENIEASSAPQRNDIAPRARDEDRRDRRSETVESASETEKVFPTWQDAISEVIQFNLNRRPQRKSGGGGRKR